MVQASKLAVDTDINADQMAESIFGNGIEITSASYTGAQSASGIFSGGDSTASNITPSDTGLILSTGKASDVTNSSADANQSAGRSTSHGRSGDSDLTDIAGQNTFDAAVLEATFVPDGDTLTMQVVFSSEEYLEYVNSGFNDSVGIWVNGEQAELTVGTGDISINNINDTTNENLYVDNAASADTYNTEMDGFTVTLTLKAPVTPGEENTIKIGIADGGDSHYDSNLLIAGNSVQTALVAGDDEISVHGTQSDTFDLLANDTSYTGASLEITAINGLDVVAGSEVTLPTGEVIVLNADGTVTVKSDGDEGTNTFSYEVTDADGNTDTAFVQLSTTPCFTPGTMIRVPGGVRAVETLRPGDLVMTLDRGPQPLRWTGMSRAAATGDMAPIRFEANALGTHDALVVSPNHRMFVSDPTAAALTGHAEVLVAAKHLVNGTSIRPVRPQTGETTLYVHLLFARHEVVFANGAAAESYYPSAETLVTFNMRQRLRMLVACPEIELEREMSYGPLARPELRRFEAACLALS